jgi:hypothetical protein
MHWHDLLFAHWPVPPAALRPLVPARLDIDTFDGAAWVGVVPFRMSGVRLRRLPALPGAGAFLELNVRTYVKVGADSGLARPAAAGVWFFSLDATSRLAVRVARAWYGLPYFDAEIVITRDTRPAAAAHGAAWGDESAGQSVIRYDCRRTHKGAARAAFDAVYAPIGPARRSSAGTLEYFLTERYCLFTAAHEGGVRIAAVRHAPWPLQPADAEIRTNTMARAAGIDLPDTAPLLHFARRLDVLAWRPQRI